MIPIQFSNIRYKGFIDEKYFVDEFLNCLESPEETFNKKDAIIIKHSDNATVAEVPISVNNLTKEIIVKRWNKILE